MEEIESLGRVCFLVNLAHLAAGDKSSPRRGLRYPIRSSSQSALLLVSPLRTPPRKHHHNKLVLETTTGASPSTVSMAGPHENDPPPTDSAKLDRILAQLTTINKRLDSHDLWLARMEKAKLSGDYDVLTTEELDTDSSKRGGSGGGDDGGSGYNRFDHQDRRGRALAVTSY